jgi:hypothetical protein
MRGKHKPSMLILGSVAKLKRDQIPALFRIVTDHEIELYRDRESFFRLLPASIQDRVTVLAQPADFPSAAPEIKCACHSSELKDLLPRKEAQLFDRHPDSTEPRKRND